MTRREIAIKAREERLLCRLQIRQVIRPALMSSQEIFVLSTTEIMRLVWGGGKIIREVKKIDGVIDGLVKGKSGGMETRTEEYWQTAGYSFDPRLGNTVDGDGSICPFSARFVSQNLEMMGFEKERTRNKRGWFIEYIKK